MNAPGIDAARLTGLFTELRLPTIKVLWPQFTEQADQEGWPGARLLSALAELEITERAKRRRERHLAEARLPPAKSLDNFDFKLLPMISKAQVMAITAGDTWLDQGANLILFGPPGGGKSHLAAAIGLALIENGWRVLFTRTTDLVQKLQLARRANVTNAGVTCVGIHAHLVGVFLDPITAIDSAFSVILGDVDGDGDLDLVAGNNFGEANRVYINDGAGSFTDSGNVLGANDTRSVTLGDLDGDGDLDLVTGNINDQANRIYFNDGAGGYTDSGQALRPNSTQSVTLGDVDGDGDLDLVAGNVGEANRVFVNDGTGSFTDSLQKLGTSSTESVTLGDVDGDLDLVTGNFNQANRVYVNDGAGSFTESGQTLGASGTHSVILGDVDGDGDLDLAASDVTTTRVYINLTN